MCCVCVLRWCRKTSVTSRQYPNSELPIVCKRRFLLNNYFRIQLSVVLVSANVYTKITISQEKMSIAPCCVHPIWHVMQFKYIRIETLLENVYTIDFSGTLPLCVVNCHVAHWCEAKHKNNLEVICKFSIYNWLQLHLKWSGQGEVEEKKKWRSPKWSCANLKSALKHQNNYVFMSPASRALCIRHTASELRKNRHFSNWFYILPECVRYYSMRRLFLYGPMLWPIPS